MDKSAGTYIIYNVKIVINVTSVKPAEIYRKGFKEYLWNIKNYDKYRPYSGTCIRKKITT